MRRAGRAAKTYQPTDRVVQISIPPRQHAFLAEILLDSVLVGGAHANVRQVVLDTCSVHFVSQAGIDGGALDGLARSRFAVRGCRTIGKRDLVRNDALPKITVNADTYEVRADGELMTCEPAGVLPLAQRYFLF